MLAGPVGLAGSAGPTYPADHSAGLVGYADLAVPAGLAELACPADLVGLVAWGLWARQPAASGPAAPQTPAEQKAAWSARPQAPG